MVRRRIAVLVSGAGSNLQAILDDSVAPGRHGSVELVISNKPQVRALERAKAAGIPAMVVDHRAYPSREAFDAEFDRRLAALPRGEAGRQPTALIYQIGGSVSGTHTLADAALAAAGFRNAAGGYRLTPGGQVPLELLVADPPDLLVLSSAPGEYRTVLADNLRHPVIATLRREHASIELPWRYWLCGTPHVVDVVEKLAAVRAGLKVRTR